MVSAKTAELQGKSDSQERFWSYWFPLGKLAADWNQADFIFFDEGRIHVHTIRMRRLGRKEFKVLAGEPEDRNH